MSEISGGPSAERAAPVSARVLTSTATISLPAATIAALRRRARPRPRAPARQREPRDDRRSSGCRGTASSGVPVATSVTRADAAGASAAAPSSDEQRARRRGEEPASRDVTSPAYAAPARAWPRSGLLVEEGAQVGVEARRALEHRRGARCPGRRPCARPGSATRTRRRRAPARAGPCSPQTIERRAGDLAEAVADRIGGHRVERVVEAGLAGAARPARRSARVGSRSGCAATSSSSARAQRARLRTTRSAVDASQPRPKKRTFSVAARAAPLLALVAHVLAASARPAATSTSRSTRAGKRIASSAADEAAHRVADERRARRSPSVVEQLVERARVAAASRSARPASATRRSPAGRAR